MKKLFLIVVASVVASPAYAQKANLYELSTYFARFPAAQIVPPIYDVACATGSTAIQQTTVPQTGHLRAWACVDANGAVTLVGSASGVGPGTTGFLSKFSSATGIGNGSCDEGVTTAGTLTCPELFTTVNTGVFTNVASTYSNLFQVGSLANLQATIGGAHITADAIDFLEVPISGVTNGFSVGRVSGCGNGNPNQTGAFGNVECVGLYAPTLCHANNTTCEGLAPSCASTSGHSGINLNCEEIGVSPSNTTDQGFGQIFSFEGATVQPAGDQMPASYVQQPTAGATFTSGYWCQNQSVTSFRCFTAGKASSSNSNSQYFWAESNDGNADFGDGLRVINQHLWQMNLALQVPAIATTLEANSVTLPVGSLVAHDTSNADSLVLCSHTGSNVCFGVQAQVVSDGFSCNSGSGGRFCSVTAASGQFVHMIFGDASHGCNISTAFYVIKDDVTDGDVMCQATQPAAGAFVGIAESNQSTNGGSLDVLTKLQ